MSALLTMTPTQGVKGAAVGVAGSGFLGLTKVTVKISHPQAGTYFESDIDSDAEGSFASTDAANPALAALTSDATNVTADDTVTIGAVTYTFKASVTTTANQVKVGATAAESLANLKAAINLEAGSGTLYGSLTVIHPTVTAYAISATVLSLAAKTAGTGGNSLTSTEASSHLSFGAATFAGGSAATGESSFRWYPGIEGIWTISATDGTTTVTEEYTVFTSGA